ncbi:A24 family peptidase [Idiomarina piscisalsi]|uniref:prepilin peptidase n=1 Tax=Idiomarina piscisalsi TaxID=1096243 RepID=UPI0013840192|nr:A24 family peptidase [Idiomarina piscisalsi]MTJ02780.1 prepilin peptidase [Idiomarina piscisalsi]
MTELFAAQTTAMLLLSVVLGAVIGSFLNVVIHRLPIQLQRQWQQECAEANGTPHAQMEPFNLAFPASHCPTCQSPIAWYDNIPLFSFLFLKARCRHCKTPISISYWLVEIVTAVSFGFIGWQYGISLPALFYSAVAGLLICLFVIDLHNKLLPDVLNYSLLWLGLLWSLSDQSPVTPEQSIVGAVIGYLALWSVYWIFKLLTKKEGMGYGDFKLLAALTAFTGATVLPVTVLAASLCGAVIGIIYIKFSGRAQPIPFGPFLIGGGLISYFWGHQLLYAYWSWLGGAS